MAPMLSTADKNEDVNLIDTKLLEIFQQVFQVDNIGDDLTIDDLELWDSMGHMELMVAVEQTFNIRIAPEDIIILTSVSSLKQYLRERI